jgi:hypothetical protein
MNKNERASDRSCHVPRLIRCVDGRITKQKQSAPIVALPLRADASQLDAPSRVMLQSAVDEIRPGPKLDALTAEKVFGWKNVHKHEGSLVGKTTR